MGFTAVKNTVCLSLLEFCPPAINPEFLIECTLTLHIQYDKSTRRNCSESTHCPAVKDQWDCVLNDLEELEGKEFLVLTGQYNIEIFYCCLRLLPSCSSLHHQTNIESAPNCSEDHLVVSRTRSHHLLLEVVLRVAEGCLFFLPLGKLDRIELVVQYQSMFFQEKV